MKAIVVRNTGGPEVMKIEDVSRPTAGPNQVLVKVQAAGVNPVDTYIRAGAYPNSKVPYTPGFDAAGTIEETGPGVTALSRGERVYMTETVTGAYAEFAVCEAGKVHRFPESISFEQAAGLNIPYATAYRALFQKAKAQPMETVLIHGASGGVGIACLQWAKAAGLTVVGTAGSDEGLKLVEEQGADQAFNHNHQNYREELMQFTSGRGVDVIIEMLANVNLGQDLTLLARNGRVVVVGSRGKVEINPRDAMGREATIHGLMLFLAPASDYAVIHRAIAAALEKQLLQPVVGKTFPLEQAAQAHEAVLAPGAYGKIILVP